MRSSRGFTLVEVVVALAISGFVLAGAASIVSVADNVRGHVERSVADHEREFIEVAWLESVAIRADRGAGLGWFGGSHESASFAANCERGGGWRAPCRVTLQLDPDTSGTLRLRVWDDDWIRIERRGMAAGAHFAYHVAGANGGVWMSAWPPGNTSPSALALVRGADTLRWRIGAMP